MSSNIYPGRRQTTSIHSVNRVRWLTKRLQMQCQKYWQKKTLHTHIYTHGCSSYSGKISKGRILDLGTGPATQAIQLAKRGLGVTASDVSEAAIRRARELYVHKDKEINFTVDNILNSKLKDKMFIMFLIGVAFMFCQLRRGQFISKK
jgi:2-polyprenyl-3-methyl-5-hydroxy-6-metoxy-1,4-benzoquinol methylase